MKNRNKQRQKKGLVQQVGLQANNKVVKGEDNGSKINLREMLNN